MKVFFVADRLIDGVNPRPLLEGGVLVENGEIRRVGRLDRAEEEAGVDIRRFPGCTLLPGLVDAHVHLSTMGSEDPWGEMLADSTTRAALKAVRNAQATLRCGVTTVRDLGSKEGVVIQVAKAIEEGLLPGVRVLPAGRCIVMTGGHGYAIGAEVDGADEARKAARQDLKAGARALKVMATGGVLTPGVEPGSPQLTIEEMRAVTEEAHKAGCRVAAHAHGNQGIKNALLAGCDTIEHCSYLDEEAIELFRSKGAIMVSTLLATMQLIWNIGRSRLPEYVVEKIKRHVHGETASLELAIRAGIRIAAGTDAGSGVNPHNPLPKQLALLAEHGMTAMQAIQAGTIVSAQALGLEDRIGSLEAGKRADLLIVRGDPLADLRALGEIAAVVQDGRITAE